MPSLFEVTAGKLTGPTTGGTVTQATNKSTAVTLNAESGQITMNNASMSSNTTAGFTLTNSFVAATDVVIVNIASGATADGYILTVDAVAAGSCRISVRHNSGGALGEALVLNFVVIKVPHPKTSFFVINFFSFDPLEQWTDIPFLIFSIFFT